jgi:dTDP-4-dehydrorhamnose 3,5-epimerase
MIFVETKLKGAYIIELERKEDHRGFFACGWDGSLLEQHGLIGRAVQQNISFSKVKGTIRGLHYQRAPYQSGNEIRTLHARNGF